jgi:hypothetical protein
MKLFLALGLLAVSQVTQSACLSEASGPIIVEVARCSTLEPKEGSASFKALPDWVLNLPPNLKTNILESHSGLLLEGKVTDSSATVSSDKSVKSALKGQDVKVFIHSSFNMQCETLKTKLVSGTLGEACCNGGSNSPCLWSTPYYLKSPKIAQQSFRRIPASSGESSLEKEVASLYTRKHYKKVVELVYPKWKEYRKDVEVIWYLTQSLKKRDQCLEAIPILEDAFDHYNKQSISLQHEKKSVDSAYLLTRCYAKTGKADEAIGILEGMALNQKLFRTPLRDMKRNPDFKSLRQLKSFQALVKKIK